MKTARLIAIGTELTTGQSVDTNSAWLARQLAERGFRVVAHDCVDDDLAVITETFTNAAARSDLVISTGGLGPTDDDLTRAALAAASGSELKLDDASLESLRKYFTSRGREMPERNQIQAMIPAVGAALPNQCGTAPGVVIQIANAKVFSLPGVPFEMRDMFANAVVPQLPATDGAAIRIRVIRTMGYPEAKVNDLLGPLLMRGNNPDVGTSAALGQISVRIVARGENAAAAEKMVIDTDRQIHERLTWSCFGRDDETLAAALGAILKEKRQTVAVAESCTGGLVGSKITDVSGSSGWFQGGVISYTNEAKHELLGVSQEILERHGAVSEPVAIAMAAGAKAKLHADYAISLTGIAGPDGGTAEKPVGLVYVGFATPDETFAIRCLIGADQPRDVIRERAAGIALNTLRVLLAHPDQLTKLREIQTGAAASRTR